MDPLDEVLDSKTKIAAERKAADHKAWEVWKKEPTPQNMEVLMDRFAPVFNSKVRLWKAPNVNPAAMLTNLKINAVEAFQKYDPNRGAALGTFLEWKLQPSKRFNTQHQNYAYIPYNQTKHISGIDTARSQLREDLGFDPSHKQVADHLNKGGLKGRDRLTARKVERIIGAQRKDVIGSSFDGDPTPHALQREREVIGLMRPDLSREQRDVFDHIHGQGGKKLITSTTAIAKALKKSPSQISRLRAGIMKKFDEHL